MCVALGVVGIFVPILPTTPFLLLAAVCYARSSRRMLNWMLPNRWFGAYVRTYREGRGIPLRQKLLTLVALWLTIALSVKWAVSNDWVRLLLFGVAGVVTLHLWRIKTARPFNSRDVGDAIESEGDPPENVIA